MFYITLKLYSFKYHELLFYIFLNKKDTIFRSAKVKIYKTVFNNQKKIL